MKPRAGVSCKSYVKHEVSETRLLELRRPFHVIGLRADSHVTRKVVTHTSLRTEIYGPVAVYLRLLALLVATYLGTAQCHDYSNNGTTKERDGDHRHAKVNVLVST
jgi:hypothetical protein